jgi:PAS domain S-box-containing protein
VAVDIYLQYAGAVTVFGAALGVIIKYLYIPIRNGIKDALELKRDMGKVDFLVAAVTRIEKEVTLNDGSSLKDAIMRLEDMQVANSGRTHSLLDGDGVTGHLETNPAGDVIWCNALLTQVTGMSAEDMRRRTWAAIMVEEDRERMVKSWESQLERESDATYFFRIVGAQSIPWFIECRTTSIKDAEDKCLGYQSRMIFHEEERWKALYATHHHGA